MYNKYQCANTSEIASPGEGHQGYCSDMVDKHFPKVFPFYVKKLWNAEGPVEAQLHHVVPPDRGFDPVMGIIVPAMFNVPQPGFGPESEHSVEEDWCVIKVSPTKK